MIPDELLNRLADFYSSEYVAKNEPWIRQIPFHEWLGRELIKRQIGYAA